MSFFTFLTDDESLVEDAASIVGDSENPDFPFSNFRERDVSLLAKSADGTTTLDLLIDLGGSYSWNLVALLNTNWTSAATITVKAGPTNTTAALSQVVTWRQFDTFYFSAAVLTHRWVRLQVSDSGNPDGCIAIGGVKVGYATTFDFNFDFGWRRRYSTTTRLLRTELGKKHVDAMYKYITLSMSFNVLTAEARAALVDFLVALDGAAVPLFLIPDPSVYDGYYVRLMTDPEEIQTMRPSIPSIVFEEESRGIKLRS